MSEVSRLDLSRLENEASPTTRTGVMTAIGTACSLVSIDEETCVPIKGNKH